MCEFQWTDSRHPNWLNDVLDTNLERMVGLQAVSGTQSDSDWHEDWSITEDNITDQIHQFGNLDMRKIVNFILRRGRWVSTNYPVTMQFLSYIDRRGVRMITA